MYFKLAFEISDTLFYVNDTSKGWEKSKNE